MFAILNQNTAVKYLKLFGFFISPCFLLGGPDICDKGGSLCIWNIAGDDAQPTLGSCRIWNLLHAAKSFLSSASPRFVIQQRACVSGSTIELNHLDLMGHLF